MDCARTAFGLGMAILVGSAGLLVGCSSADPRAVDPPPDSGPAPENTTGTVSLNLTLPGGENVGSLSYDLTNGVSRLSGTQTARLANELAVVIAGVPAGSGYSIQVVAASADNLVSCTGSYGTGISDAGQDNGAPFQVSVKQPTIVNLQLICVRNRG